MTTHWALRLRSFDDDAPRTLLAQHDLLQLLVDGGDESLSLTIRVVATPSKGDVNVVFYLICEGSTASGALAKTLHDLAAVGLLTGYNLGSFTDVPAPFAGAVAELQPRLENLESLPIKPDWSQVFDLIRRRGQAITVDLRCNFTTRGAEFVSEKPLAIMGSDSGTSVLETLANAGDGGRYILLTTIISEPKRIDRAFALAIGAKTVRSEL